MKANMKKVNLFNDSIAITENSQYKFPISFLKPVFENDLEIEHLYERPHIQAKGKGRNKTRPYSQSYCQISKWIC
jgi:hypothetical protein